MKKLLIYALPVALKAAPETGTPWSGWGGMVTSDLGADTAQKDDALLVLVQHRGEGCGTHVNRANVNWTIVNRGNVNRTSFNSNNFHRDVSVNRNVVVVRGNSGPNWGGVAVDAGITVAANSTSYPPPPPYPYGY